MKKVSEEVEEDIFKLVKSSAIASAIGGNIYRNGMRPFNSRNEDVVIVFLTGTDSQIQSGIVNINAYVPDIDMGVQLLVKNISRCKALGIILKDLPASMKSDLYRFTLDSMIQTFEEKDINQHYVNARLKFQLVTF